MQVIYEMMRLIMRLVPTSVRAKILRSSQIHIFLEAEEIHILGPKGGEVTVIRGHDFEMVASLMVDMDVDNVSVCYKDLLDEEGAKQEARKKKEQEECERAMRAQWKKEEKERSKTRRSKPRSKPRIHKAIVKVSPWDALDQLKGLPTQAQVTKLSKQEKYYRLLTEIDRIDPTARGLSRRVQKAANAVNSKLAADMANPTS